MKIMLVTMDYPPPMGGIQRVAKNLEEDLRFSGHEVCLVNVDGRNTSNYRRVRPPDFFPQRVTSNNYYHPSNLLNPLKLMRPSGYRDFVYSNMIYRLASRARSHFRPEITHIMKETLYAAVFNCAEPFVVSCHGWGLRDTFPVRYCLENAAVIHCVSGHLQDLARGILGDGANRSVVIHNSIDLQFFQAQIHRKRENIIITTCRMVEEKNVDSILRAITHLSRTNWGKYRYLIIGDGPELNRLKRLRRKLGLEGVEFLGEIRDKNTLSVLLGRSKLFVLCPKPIVENSEIIEEGFGISFIEAQAAGIPVISSKIGGIPEAVGNGGLFVENPSDPMEIAARIDDVLNDRELYDRLRTNAINRSAAFDRRRTVREFEQIYRKALDTI